MNVNNKKLWEEFTNKYKEFFIPLKDENEKNWYDNYLLLKKHILEHNNIPCIRENALGKWVSAQKQKLKNNQGSISINDEYKKLWEEFTNKYKEFFMTNEEIWYNQLKNLKEYIKQYKKLPTRNKMNDEKILKLNTWLSTQKKIYKKNINIMKINDKIKLEWEKFIDEYYELLKTKPEIWLCNLNKLINYINKTKRLPRFDKNKIEENSLYNWYRTQLYSYKNNINILKNEKFRKKWEEFVEEYKHLFFINLF